MTPQERGYAYSMTWANNAASGLRKAVAESDKAFWRRQLAHWLQRARMAKSLGTYRWHQRCPAYLPSLPCRQPYGEAKNCETFVCSGCGRRVPWCFGGSEDELCNDCWAKASVT